MREPPTERLRVDVGARGPSGCGPVGGEQDRFEHPFRNLVTNTLSFHDVTADKAESCYHAFVIGMLVYLNATHEVRSNRESGYGRYDVMIIPRDPARYSGVVIEFKIVPKGGTKIGRAHV